MDYQAHCYYGSVAQRRQRMLTKQVSALHVPSVISPFMPPNMNQNTYYCMERIERLAQRDCFDSFRYVRKKRPFEGLFPGAARGHFAPLASQHQAVLFRNEKLSAHKPIHWSTPSSAFYERFEYEVFYNQSVVLRVRKASCALGIPSQR